MLNLPTPERPALSKLARAVAPMQAAAGAGTCVHDLFRAQAARTPEAVALSWRGERLTYAQLEARANQISSALRRRDVGPEVRVGICLPRTPELVAAMLGVLGAGGAYVPLDPAYPRERLGYMLQDAGVTLVITDSALADRLPESAAGLLLLDVERDAIAAESAAAPESGVVPENLSHVIFTSGSTGRPKGVMIRHSSVVVLLHWLRENVTDEERSSVLFSTSINFDVSVAEVFGTLAWGGKLVLVENALELATLDEEVVHVSMVPSAAAELLRGGGIPACVKTLNLGGEALPNALAQGLYALGTVEKVGNLYGPTEDTTYSTYYVVPRGADEMLVGTPVSNTQAYVLDDDLQPVASGAVGELYLAGDGLSRGYANRPALTAERFVPCPFGAPGARMYRVMDRVRWRESAEVRECVSAGVDSVPADSRTDALTHSRTAVLEYLGRTDFQVKIRGYRIELGEIEARLAEHPGVRAPVVLAREDAPGDRRLVAYYLADEPVAVEALKSHLAERLPEYMVPAAYVWLERLPLTPNGKTDRGALPAPGSDAFPAGSYEAPVGPVEEALAESWAAVLGAERVGRTDDFFELGGHSLLAMQVISRVREALGAEVSLQEMFERPVLADFAAGLQTAARAEAAAIERVDRTGNVPLSFGQARLWFLEQMGSLGSTYHIPIRLRLRGALDRGALVRALDRIVARHEALRTTFPSVDGEPVQRIARIEESAFRLVEHDLHAAPDAEDALRRIISDEADAPFDLAQGPLIRGRLVRMAADDHVLLLTMHHIVSDGWSLGVLHRELGALYAAFARGEPDPLPPLPIQYADYAVWHRRWVSSHAVEAQAEYWTRTLAGAPELLELPTDHPRPAKQDFTGASVTVELDEALTAALKTVGQRHGATLFMTLLAGWAAVLARLSGQDEVVVGTPSANRGRAEVEELIGFFVNTLPVRVDLSDGPSVGGLLEQVRARALEAQRNQDIPFEQVVERLRPARSLAYTPLVQVMFAWQNAPGGALELPGLAVVGAEVADADTAQFDLSLALWEDDGRIAGALSYATALFDRATAERHAGYLRRVLEEMAADDARPVDRLELLSAEERARVVVEWNRTEAAYPRESCIHALFEAQARRTPGAVAVEYEDRALAYAELNARANRLAHHLRSLGVGPDARVALCAERGVETVVAMLAVLKAGGAYVPLDPSYPDERLRYMLADSRPAVLLASRPQAARFAAAGVPVLDPADDAAWAHLPATDPRPEVSPDHLAYVIYTSGSTGRPKGVAVPHRGVASLLADFQRRAPIGEGDGCSLWTSTSFDVSVYEIFSALLAGGRLCIPRDEVRLEAGAFLDWMEAREVRSAYLPPYFLPELRDRVSRSPGRTRLHRLLVGVEPIAEPLLAEIRRSIPGLRIINGYGPTETTICATLHDVPDTARGERVTPIGAPAANTRVFVLDARMRPVPTGVVGELYVGGAGVARGYLDRPALTAERFVPDPLSGQPGARLYRTGDLGRWLPEGALAFAGRTDAQVKVRGYRVEPGEIEARLVEHPAVREAVVLAREDAPGEKRLVAYVVGDETGADLLRAHLAERLPEHMVPAAYVRLETLPLTPSGKVDRRALPAPDGGAYPRRGYEAPLGEVEQIVAGIWAELLGAERVGRLDHFFELGGHSLLAVRVASRVREALGVEALPRDLFERPVLADFARGLETAARAETAAIEHVDRAGSVPLSFAQQRLWFLEQLGGMGAAYHVPMSLRLRGGLDRGALVRALDRIVARHEVLRTTFPSVDGEPVQRIARIEESAFRLVEHDLHAAPDAEDALRRIMSDEASAPFDLAHGPLVRGRLVRMATDNHVLLLTMHHIVSDGWSAGVLFRELGALYAAFARSEPDPLAPLPVQYADYAVWHRRQVEGAVLEAQAEYWRETLAGAPELLELPTDHPRPAKQEFAGASVKVELDEALTAALRTLGQRHGATLFMTLLAGWAAVLARLSGQDEVVVGTPSANRGRAEVEELIGFFVNTLPLRVDLSDGPSVGGLLEQVRARALEAQRNQDIPFEQVVERLRPVRSLAYAPLFQVMFAWQDEADGGLALPGLTVADAGVAGRDTAKFDLTLTLWQDGGRIVGDLEYATALFEHATIERFAEYLRRVLTEMAQDDAVRVDGIPLLPPAERVRLVEEWSAGDAAPPAEQCIHELFEAQAARTPNATALVHEGERLTYAELDARANRLAHRLASRGVERGAAVGVCLEWRPELVVALLATLKAGGVYVPLDPSLPAARLAYIAEDAGVRAVVTRAGLADRVPSGVEVVDVDADEVATAPAGALRSWVCPADLAYVIYTSGSTGQPKGVAVEHGAAAAHLLAVARVHGIVPEDRVLQFASAGFDVSLEQVFFPLLTGATLVLRGAELWSATEFRARVRALGITVANLPPAYWQEVSEGAAGDALAGIRLLLIGGDALPATAADARGAGKLVNCYGPTETVVTATAFAVERGAAGGPLVPIGRPLPGRAVYVLDPGGAPVPVGVAGELYIGGPLLARGYLGRPALTAERFVPDPFGRVPGGRLYRTGDRVRWRESAEVRECVSAEVGSGSAHSRTDALTHSRTAVLEFLGRTDFQVKIRGFRIELGEIEAALRGHHAVRDAVVLARADGAGETRLVAYLVGDADAEALRAHLAERVPEYMVPAAYVLLDALPLTPNGKLDRKALPAPDGDAFATRGYEAPSGQVEQAVAAIWAELLGVERVGRGDHFFELGGHSLLAVRVVSRVRQALGVEAQPGDVFERPVLADFARGLQTSARAEAPAIERVDRTGSVPLSFAQKRLWFLEQLGGMGAAYHIPTSLRLRGELDRGALVRSLDRIVARHEVLRTSFPTVGGEPVQRIAPVEESAFRLVEHDLRASAHAEDELRRLMRDEASAFFDLARGPLVHGRLVRMAADDHVLLLTMHHIVSDGWSAGVLFRELGALYAAFARGEPDPLPPLPVQYADYAAWHRRWVEGPVLEAQAEYWRETLAGAPELLELPTDHPRPAKQEFAGASVKVELDEALTAALKTLGQRHGATLFMTLLAGWAAVLARLSGQDDFVIGTPSANRGRAEVEELIGFFVNMLPLRVDLSDGPRVGELLQRVKTRALEAQRNQDIPFEQVVERVQPARSLAHSPLFQVMFAWQNASDGTLQLPGLEVVGADVAESDAAKFDLTLTLWEDGGRIVGSLEYATALFERATVQRFAEYLRRVLAGMAQDDAARMDGIPMLPAAERARLVQEWNASDAAPPAGQCIHHLFEAQAARTPDAAALVCAGERLTCAELNAAANRLARRLRAAGVHPEARVGVMLERSAELVVALLAVLKAGGAYLPLDPSLPAARRAALAADAGAAVLVTREPGLEGFAGRIVSPAEAGGEDGDDLGLDVPAAALAYVIYTSGSTGTPKGVGVAHAEAAAHCRAAAAAYGLTPADRVLQFAAAGFDVSLEQMLAPLAAGACVVLRGNEVPTPLELARQAAEQGMTVINPPTAYWHQLAADAAALELLARTVRLVIAGGEAMSPAAARGWAAGPAAGVRLLNAYGPTEAVITCTAYDVPPTLPEGVVHVPVGRPLPGRAAYVLDGWGEPAPLGAPGELCIGGVLARGYLGRPAATAAAFVPDPFSATPGARMYRTGDRARWLAAGEMEFLGRRDHQVKVRGYRIEPGEIEARLAEHASVREAVVLAREDTPGDRRLVAYVVSGEDASAEALRAHLGKTLPAYMVPSAFVRLEQFPLTPNGKLDRGALPAPEGDAGAAREYEAPVGKVEQALAEMWTELLRVERVGRGDDFFMLGGHSLLAVQMISRVREAMDVELALGAVFEKPVLSALADRIVDLRLARFDPETLARLAQLVRAPGAETVPAREEPG